MYRTMLPIMYINGDKIGNPPDPFKKNKNRLVCRSRQRDISVLLLLLQYWSPQTLIRTSDVDRSSDVNRSFNQIQGAYDKRWDDLSPMSLFLSETSTLTLGIQKPICTRHYPKQRQKCRNMVNFLNDCFNSIVKLTPIIFFCAPITNAIEGFGFCTL